MSHINLDLQASHKMLMLLDEANTNTEQIIDRVPGVFLIINEDHEVLRANHGFVELLGLDAENIFRLPLSRFFQKENWKMFAHKIKQIVESESPDALSRFEMGLEVAPPDAQQVRPFHWTLTKQPVKNTGESRLITVFGTDISELRESERRLTKVFSSIPLGIFTMNKDGTVGDSYSSYLELMLNHGKLAGVAIEDVLFKPAMLNANDETVKGIHAIRNCMGVSELEYGSFARIFPQEIFHNTKVDPKDGRWFRITYQPIVFDQVVEQLLIILEDRTAIVNAEMEMLDAALEKEKATAMEKQSLAMYEDAIRDTLTGLYTRLYMKDAVAALLWSHDHQEIAEVSMVIFDIDHFKVVNDTYGHKNGDLVLGQLARVILSHAQKSEIPIRFGGEEFVIFMSYGCDAAFALAERVRKEIEAMLFDLGETVIRVTISGGVAQRQRNEALDDFMHRADQLLYRAKNSGRNQNMSAQ